MFLQPIDVCHLLGHKRTGYNPDAPCVHYRWRNRWYMRCDRCGTTDAGEVYREGLFEPFTWWRMRIAFYHASDRVRHWMWSDCTDCGEPLMRFGRHIGRHDDDRHIPF